MARGWLGVSSLVPRGETLTDDEFERRHRTVLVLAAVQAPLAAIVGSLAGAGAGWSLAGAGVTGSLTLVAWGIGGPRRLRALGATMALLSAAVVVFAATQGRTEALVHILLLVALVSLYQDWFPIGSMVVAVFANQRVAAALDPGLTDGGLVALSDPWAWAGVHAGIVGLMGAICLVVLGANAATLRRRDRAEADVREDLAQATAVTEASPDGVLVIDDKGSIVSVNDRLVVMWRIPRRLLAAGDTRQVLAAAASLAKEPNVLLRGLRELHDPATDPVSDEIELRDGRVYERVSAPLMVGVRAIGRVWTFRDATAERQTAAKLQRAIERLRARDTSRELFLTAVSHDMRTPLQAVTGFAQLLRDRGDELSGDERAEFIGIVHEKAQRLEQLVSNLLDLDRISRGTLEPQRDAVDLGELIKRVISNVDVGQRVIDLDVETVHARVDRSMIERVVENLVVNAAKHTPPEADIRVRLRASGDDAIIAVDDRGPGIPDELKERVFRPFVRGSRDEPSPGSGIGLSLVARFVELHGGRTWVEDRPGGGSSFRVQFPGVLPSPDMEPVQVKTRTDQPRTDTAEPVSPAGSLRARTSPS